MANFFPELPRDLVVDCTAESLAFTCRTNKEIADKILTHPGLTDIPAKGKESGKPSEIMINDKKAGKLSDDLPSPEHIIRNDEDGQI